MKTEKITSERFKFDSRKNMTKLETTVEVEIQGIADDDDCEVQNLTVDMDEAKPYKNTEEFVRRYESEQGTSKYELKFRQKISRGIQTRIDIFDIKENKEDKCKICQKNKSEQMKEDVELNINKNTQGSELDIEISGKKKTANKYLQILFYYVQDAVLFKVNLPKPISKAENIIVKILQFTPEVLAVYQNYSNVCFTYGASAISKTLMKSIFGPCVMLFFLMFYLLLQFSSKMPFLQYFSFPLSNQLPHSGLFVSISYFSSTDNNWTIYSSTVCTSTALCCIICSR